MTDVSTSIQSTGTSFQSSCLEVTKSNILKAYTQPITAIIGS